MNYSNKYSHLTLDERRIILTGITNGSTKAAIAKAIGKDKSTVGKEIKAHRFLVKKSPLPLECSSYRKCVFDRKCTPDCPDFIPFRCSRRDRSPGACNGCSIRSKCRFDKYDYNPEKAHAVYLETLVDSRAGVNLTSSEAKTMADIIAPLLKKGLSPYHILQAHPELGICEKTIYNSIESGVFKEVAGLSVLDLRRQVSRKLPESKKTVYKKRQDRRYLQGRTYKDYRSYLADNPDVFITQMDTVYNDETQGPFIQTFKFVKAGLLFALLHEEKTTASMLSGVNMLEKLLGLHAFRKYVHVLLTDRGSEFSAADAIEKSADGSRRTRLFFCDPMQSGQKGSLENNHITMRYIIPKKTDLRRLGLVNQDALNLVLSHVNSAPVESLGGKSPLELTEFLYPDLYEKLTEFGIHKINSESIILKPYLLKNR